MNDIMNDIVFQKPISTIWVKLVQNSFAKKEVVFIGMKLGTRICWSHSPVMRKPHTNVDGQNQIVS